MFQKSPLSINREATENKQVIIRQKKGVIAIAIVEMFIDFSILNKSLKQNLLVMKKTILAIIIIMATCGFYGCNESGDKKADTPSADSAKTDATAQKADITINCTGITNLLITNDSAFAMMARYDSIYRKSKTAKPIVYLSNSEWIDAMIINSYANFFESNAGKAFDGVRFVNAATNNTNKSRLLMVPTRPNIANPKKRDDIWGKNLVPLETGDPTEYLDFETSESVATDIKNNFYQLYRTGRGLPRDKDPLSESIWLSRCVFIYLRDEIKKPGNQIDGIRIYMGAYGKMMGTVPGQIHENQSSILLVPTTSGGAKVHNDRWDLLRPKDKIKGVDALNHGELCPQKCE
jgi:hypothetical protein